MLFLSLFPGIDIFGMGMELEFPDAAIVRGPDLLWGGDARTFHIPAGRFDGIFGGPPCQLFSALRFLNPHAGKHGNLIPEFERIVSEGQPPWFLMENVPNAPEPVVAGYIVHSVVVNNRWVPDGDSPLGAVQERTRRFSFGTPDGRRLVIEPALFENPEWGATVLAGHGPVGRGKGYMKTPSIEEACRLQGLPEDFTKNMPFTTHGKRSIIGNGLSLPMARAVARAVKRALAQAGAL